MTHPACQFCGNATALRASSFGVIGPLCLVCWNTAAKADELRVEAETARDAALLRERLAFQRKYGDFMKCATCGAGVNFSAALSVSCTCARAEWQRHTYSAPPYPTTS